jgi:DNA polymerase-3 subunit alpha (Gram-positive type)
MILVFDWETTGLTLHPDADLEKQPHAIEFGGMYLSPSSGRVIEEFSFLIHPGMLVSEEITKITGITNDMLDSEPRFKDRFPKVRSIFAGATCMIAHNLPFDKAILQGELARLGVAEFPWPAKELCTVGLYKEAWGRNPRLIELYENVMGKKYEQTHRGLDDVKALVEIVQRERLWELA